MSGLAALTYMLVKKRYLFQLRNRLAISVVLSRVSFVA